MARSEGPAIPDRTSSRTGGHRGREPIADRGHPAGDCHPIRYGLPRPTSTMSRYVENVGDAVL
jgi:hypothetical protein